jgi:hypothetical protein
MRYAPVTRGLDDDREYDLFVYSVGYERRSSHALRLGLTGRRTLALCFEKNHVLSFEDNLAIAKSAGATIFTPSTDDGVRGLVGDYLPSGALTFRIAVDISSMPRQRIASFLLAFDEAAKRGVDVEMDFFYSPAAFSSPPLTPSSTLHAGPVLREYSGRLRRTSLPIGTLIGLGYEPQRAMGAFELLEPTTAWAFRPQGGDPRFTEALQTSNDLLLRVLGEDRVFDYKVEHALDTVYALESFVYAVQGSHRLVLLPMGPKIFALACLLVALSDEPDRPAVWRVGERVYSHVSDIEENGNLVGLGVTSLQGRHEGATRAPRVENQPTARGAERQVSLPT